MKMYYCHQCELDYPKDEMKGKICYICYEENYNKGLNKVKRDKYYWKSKKSNASKVNNLDIEYIKYWKTVNFSNLLIAKHFNIAETTVFRICEVLK